MTPHYRLVRSASDRLVYFKERKAALVSVDDLYNTNSQQDAYVFHDVHEAVATAKWAYDTWSIYFNVEITWVY